MKNFKKNVQGFILVEILITMALISIFLLYFIPSIFNTLKNDEIQKQNAEMKLVAQEVIEKSIANGRIYDEYKGVKNKYDLEFEISKQDDSEVTDVKLTVKSKDGKRSREYAFTFKNN